MKLSRKIHSYNMPWLPIISCVLAWISLHRRRATYTELLSNISTICARKYVISMSNGSFTTWLKIIPYMLPKWNRYNLISLRRLSLLLYWLLTDQFRHTVINQSNLCICKNVKDIKDNEWDNKRIQHIYPEFHIVSTWSFHRFPISSVEIRIRAKIEF